MYPGWLGGEVLSWEGGRRRRDWCRGVDRVRWEVEGEGEGQ